MTVKKAKLYKQQLEETNNINSMNLVALESTNELTEYQFAKLKHCFGLDHARKPYRNYYHCNKINDEWEDMVVKGYATKRTEGEKEIIYFGTWKALQTVYKKNVTYKYYEDI